MLFVLGLAGFAISAAVLAWAGTRPAPRPYPAYGRWALVALALLELLLALRAPGVVTFFTALIWTAFIPAVDAAVFRLRGDSRLRHPARFAALCLLSIPIWLIFEAYNLHLRNWRYVGVPRELALFIVGGSWAFATILPGILEVADLLLAAGLERRRSRPGRAPGGWAAAAVVVGVILLVAPLAVPGWLAPYLFGLVWGGFVLVLEPVNRRLGLPSVWSDLERGAPGRLYALLAAGAICGFCWEFWNFWAASRWEYIFPIFQHSKIFAMPWPGFFGFPPFAWECFALTSFVSWLALPEPLRPEL